MSSTVPMETVYQIGDERSEAAAMLRRVAAEVWTPRRVLPVDQWAERYRVLPPGSSSRPGPWSHAEAPYLREPMAALTEEGVETVTLMTATQTGKTETLINFLLWMLDQSPGPTLLVYPNIELGRSVMRDRIQPSVLACPQVAGRLRSTRTASAEMSTTMLQTDRATVWVTGSNSEANLASRPIRYLVVDELDAEEFSASGLELARQRTKTYTDRKILQCSSPSLAEHGIHAQYLLGDRRAYWCPCPACDRFSLLRWADVKWDGGTRATVEQARATARWVCPHCQQPAADHQRREMISRGRWVPDGQVMSAAGEIEGVPANDSATHRSYHLSSLAVPRIGWGDLAARFVSLRAGEGGPGLRVFVNGELGEPWRERGEQVSESELGKLFVPVKAGGYAMVPPVDADGYQPGMLERGGQLLRLPAEVVALVGFADLQRDRAYVEIRGLTVRAEQSLLVWCGEVACPADQPGSLHALDKIVRGRWPHPSGAMVPVAALAIDSGDGARTLEVYHWTGTHGNVYASKGVAGSGSGSQGMVRPWTLDLAEYDPAAGERGMKPMSAAPGRVRSGRVRFLTINTNVYKSRAMAVLQQARADPAKAALRFCEAGERTARYVEHLTAEHLVRRTRPDGRVVLAWELRPGRTDNHHWDTLVGCMALTDAMGAEEQLTPEATAAAMARWRPEAVAAPVRAEGGGGGSAWAMGGAGGWTL